MPIRMTGLNSGLDTESIIAALMSAQRTKQTKVENKRTKLEWKKEQWASLNTKIYNFYTNSLSKMRMASTYMTKAATSSNNSKVTAKATTAAATGSYSVVVKQVASAQKVTSGKLKGAVVKDDDGNLVKDENGKVKTEAATSKTKLKDLDGAGFEPGTQIKVAAGNKTVFLEVGDDTTISDFVGKLNDAGLTASFDEKQQRFFISSSKSGADNKFTITSATMDQNQQDATKALKDLIGYDSLSAANKNTADSIMAGLQTGKSVDDVIEKLTTLANDYSDKEAKRKATELYTAEAKASVLDGFDDEVRKSLKQEDSYTVTDDDRIKYLKDKGFKLDTSDGKTQADALKEAKDKYADKEAAKLIKKDDYKTKIENALSNGLSQSDIDAVKTNIANSGVTLDPDTDYTFDNRMDRTLEVNKNIDAAAKEYSAKMNGFLSGDDAGDGKALAALGLEKVNGTEHKEDTTNGTGMAVIAAADTQIEYNGATLTSDTTNITVAGLELNILSKTADNEVINISVTNDSSGVYDTIKEFVSEYNALLKEMNTFYNAGSANDYDVLSDEEKDAMSESEVEKWEGKIKDSLLRRDSTLGAIVSSFKNNMMGTYTSSDGKKYALSSIGIMTSKDYKEGGLLHILGDEDDSEYADKKNVLKSMLDENPDAVVGVLTSLTETLYSDLQKKMSATKMSSALTFYNDKEMSSQLSDYKDEISKWQSRLDEMEDKYYKQFSAMETALANLQSQQNSLASMLGGGN
ncbi:MAG: flagellar filament capping protein FliD [Clostridia bacterium]|nr:flagellar filament capping protein FliD [Clostridia bacterium]MCI9078494.1 flagellar filament capping protein FliD [Lachnospiraceae bacterium]